MNYDQTLKYLYEKLPMYQRSGAIAYKNNLDNTIALDNLFNHPHRNFKSIHVAGTNGKGSVSHMLASVLQNAGYKVGLYTSPHLKDYRERIKINGEMITEDAVCDFVQRFHDLNFDEKIEPSFFELSVAMAFDYFSNEKIDFAVVEVGLGGRLDSTNIILPEISIITNISLDHTYLLGNTLTEIAYEKAGIIKKNVPVIIGETQNEITSVFTNIADIRNAPIQFADRQNILIHNLDGSYSVIAKKSAFYKNIELDLKGKYQQKNLVTVIAAISVLKRQGIEISDESVNMGLSNVVKNTGLKGRWQLIGEHPRIICDTGHNEAGIELVTEQLSKEKYNKLHIVFGTVNDKDVTSILKLLPFNASYYFTKANIDRAMDVNTLMAEAVALNLKGKAYKNVEEALNAAKQCASKNDLIFVGGSTFIVAEVI